MAIKRSRALVIFTIIASVFVFFALAVFVLRSAYAASAADAPLRLLEPSPKAEVEAAWRRARDAGAYDFIADVTQRTVPLPKVANVGRGSQEERYYLEGRNNIKDTSLQFSILEDSDNINGAPAEVEVRIDDGRAFLRQNGRDWEEVDDFTTVMAPEGDFLGYLVAMKDVVFVRSETRAGISFGRYSFTLDGPLFAAYMRDELQKQLTRNGELPPGITLDYANHYKGMVGSGEIWIDEAGFPLRQIIHLRFPDTSTDYLEAEVDVTFTGFSPPQETSPIVGKEVIEKTEGALSRAFFLILPLGFVFLLITRSRSRRLYGLLTVIIIASMLISPLLQSAKAAEFSEKQARITREKANREEAARDQAEQWQLFLRESRESLIRYLAKNDMPVDHEQVASNGSTGIHENLSALAQSLALTAEKQVADPIDNPNDDDDGDGLTNASEAELGTDPNDPDSDDDGLTDFEESELGTKPLYYDSDYDLITDTLEVAGFEYPEDSGQWWYPDPLNMDSNGDGLPDTAEWHGNESPLDMDNDGVPDLFDDDNDGDGVPDNVDLSPHSHSDPQQPYDEDRPFMLSIEGLEPGRPTYVDFQIRPVNPDHLWYAYNVLDWPHDDQGPIRDTTEKTFADLLDSPAINGDGTLAGPVAYNGDLRLLPMLEIRISGEEGILPSDQDLQNLYGGIVMELPLADGVAQKAVYLPLQLISEEDGSAKVAFYARMLYQPSETWHTQNINVVWLIQALLDYCAEYDDTDQTCLDPVEDEAQIIQVYPDEWYLTGLNIQENRGYNAAVIWEDPAVDDNVQVEGALFALPLVLDDVFLTPLDEDSDGVRDVDVAELERRLDYTLNAGLTFTERWGITRTLRVYTGSYDHPDIGQYSLALMTDTYTTTTAILEGFFDDVRPVTPTILYATEQSIRYTNLDDAGWINGWEMGPQQGISITMSSLPEYRSQEHVAVRKQSYCYDEELGTWTACPLVERWKMIGEQCELLVEDDPDRAEIQCMLLRMWDLNLSRGLTSQVSMGGLSLNIGQGPGISDSDLAESIAGLGQDILQGVAKRIFKKIVGESFSDLAAIIGKTHKEGFKEFFTSIVTTRKGIALLLEFSGGLLSGFGAGFNVDELQLAGDIVFGVAMLLDDGWDIYKSIKEAYDLVKGIKNIKFFSQLKQVMRPAKMAKIAGYIGIILEVAAIWVVFGILLETSDIGFNTIAGQEQFASAIAQTMIAVLLFMIAMTGYGIIFVVLFVLIEIILGLALPEGFSFSEKLTVLMYSFSEIATPDVKIEETDLRLLEPISRGLPHFFKASIVKLAKMQEPDSSVWDAWQVHLNWQWFYTEDALKRSAVVSTLSEKEPQTLEAKHGSMVAQWETEKTRDYKLGAYTRPFYDASIPEVLFITVLLRPGINVPLPVHLNTGFDMPVISCIWVPWGVIAAVATLFACKEIFADGSVSHYFGESVILDPLPATLDEFYEWREVQVPDAYSGTGLSYALSPAEAGGYRLAWDDKFPILKDADGDGLISKAYGGLDPDDSRWDTDGDSLSDLYEMERRFSGTADTIFDPTDPDTDGDGLCDDEEARLGTSANRQDTDGDGLNDGVEVFHQDRCDVDNDNDKEEWLGGWQFIIESTSTFTAFLTSDPLSADSDGDGLNDRAEYILGENPRAWTPNPVVVDTAVSAKNQVVKPGQTLVYTLTVRNQMVNDPPLYVNGDLEVNLPVELTGQSPEQNFSLGSSEAITATTTLLVTGESTGSGETTQVNIAGSVSGFVHDGDMEDYVYPSVSTTPYSTSYANAHYTNYPPYVNIEPMPRAVITSALPYAVAALDRPAVQENTLPDGHVYLYNAGGELGDPTDVLLDERYPTTFLGDYSPGLACNDAGQCLVTWERGFYGRWVEHHLEDISYEASKYCDEWYAGYGLFNTRHGPASVNIEVVQPGSSYHQSFANLPCDHKGLWPSRLQHTIFNNDLDTILKFTEYDFYSSNDVEEEDINWNESTWNPEDPWTQYTEDLYIGNQDLNLRIEKSILHRGYADGVYGQLLGSQNGPIELAAVDESLLSWDTGVDFYGKIAVASDGQDFLTVWSGQDWQENNGDFIADGPPQISARKILSDGTQTGIVVEIDQINSVESGDPAVVWAAGAGRYLVLWRNDGLQAALVTRDGQLVSGSRKSLTSNEAGSFDIAFNRHTGQALLLYEQGRELIYLLLDVTTSTITFDNPETLASIGPLEEKIQWPAVAYEPRNSGWLASWLVASYAGDKELHYMALDSSGELLRVALDDLGQPLTKQDRGRVAIAGSTPIAGALPFETYRHAIQQDLACSEMTTDFAACAFSGILNGGATPELFLHPLEMELVSHQLWSVTQTTSLTLTIDDQAPVAEIGLTAGGSYKYTGAQVIGGQATDPGQGSAGVASVEVRINGGEWQRAMGGSTWAYAWSEIPEIDGTVIVEARAIDQLGHVQPIPTAVTIYLDRSAPNATMTEPGENPVKATYDEQAGVWKVQLAGTTSPDTGSLDVALDPDGSGWEEAGVIGEDWSLNYPLNTLGEPTGIYTVSLRSTDLAGNIAEFNAGWPISIDNTPPDIALSIPISESIVISQSIDLNGIISDTGPVTSGPALVEVSLTMAGTEAPVWEETSLENIDDETATWSFATPLITEGIFRLHLRGRDALGNQREDPQSRRLLHIDNQSPQAACQLQHLGAGPAAQTTFQAQATDFNLEEESFGLQTGDSGPIWTPGITQRSFLTDSWYLETISDTGRLVGLAASGLVSGHVNLTVVAGDANGRVTELPCTTGAILDPAPASAIHLPADGTVLDNLDTVLIRGGAYATEGLNYLSLTANGSEIYSKTWANGAQESLWSYNWDPPAEGVYTLVSQVEDQNGVWQEFLQPTAFYVDVLPPAVSLNSTVLNETDRLSYNRVALLGSVTDTVGLDKVLVSVDGGANWQVATLETDSWRYPWSIGLGEPEPDGRSVDINVRALDLAGHRTTVTGTVFVDLVPPQSPTVTLGYMSGGDELLLEPGQTIVEVNPTLVISWTQANDGPFTTYAGWSDRSTPDIAALSQVTGGRYEETSADLQKLYAHLLVEDLSGNRTTRTLGPVFVDAPGAPDYVTDLGYHGWWDSTCNQLGADWEVARFATGEDMPNGVQRLYATWGPDGDGNGQALRLSWTGATWNVDGDLFLYLDTGEGGSGYLFDPYGIGPEIALPDGMAADFVILVEDDLSAALYVWDGQYWSLDRELDAKNFRLRLGNTPTTDLLIPFEWLWPGQTVASPAGIKMLALASEEEQLRLWAAGPDKNPLNSEKAVASLAYGLLDRPFALINAATWGENCSNQSQQPGSDLRLNLVAEPPAVVARFQGDDLASVLSSGQWLDGDHDGEIDRLLPLDNTSAWVGQSQEILYTLSYSNSGTAASNGVQVTFDTYGLAGLADITFPDISPGESGSVNFTAKVVDSHSAELVATVSDDRHGAYDWIWAQHRVDTIGPDILTIDQPEKYLSPGPNLFIGQVYDPSGTDQILLKINGDDLSCQGPGPGDVFWFCPFVVPDADAVYTVQARATDRFGNVSEWIDEKMLIVDRQPPTVSLSSETEIAMFDGVLVPGELELTGLVHDLNEAAAVELCLEMEGDPEENCITEEAVPVNSGNIATWQLKPPFASDADALRYDLFFYGYDSAGNRSVKPLTRTVLVDQQGPLVTLEQHHTVVPQALLLTLFSGFLEDGSGIQRLRLRITEPDGTITWQPLDVFNGEWSYDAYFNRQLGRHTFMIEAEDIYGNLSRVGPRYVTVFPSNSVADLSLALQASAGYAVSGMPFTYTVIIKNLGPGVAPGTWLEVTLPDQVTTSGGETGTIRYDLGLLGYESEEILIRVDVPFTVTRTLALFAQTGSETMDLVPGNNRRTLYTPVIQPISGLQAYSDSPTALGQNTTLSATVETGNRLWFVWDFGDGQKGSGSIATHIYPPSNNFSETYPILGMYTATVTTTNSYNQMMATTVVRLINDEPSVDVSGLDQIVFEDDVVQSGLVIFVDINQPDSHSASFDWGDGTTSYPDEFHQTASGGWFAGSHVYDEPGVYLVTVTVKDRYGGVGVGTFTITVIHGFMRYCSYATTSMPGVSIGSESVLDCGRNPANPNMEAGFGGVGSRYRIQTGSGVIITGNLLSQRDQVLLGPDSLLIGEVISIGLPYLFTGHIIAEGDVILQDRVHVDGNVTGRSNVELWPQSFVGGHITATGQVEIASSATVSGSINQGAIVGTIPEISPVFFSFSAAKSSVTVQPSSSRELPPGRYGALQVREGATLQLSAGRYTFERIQAKKDARIEFDLHEGWINIDVVKTIEFNEGVTMAIISDEGLASDILFRVMGQVVNLHSGGHYLGTYLAPSASVQLGDGAELTGALYGKKVDVREQAQITGMPARDLFALIQVNPDLGLANTGLAISSQAYSLLWLNRHR